MIKYYANGWKEWPEPDHDKIIITTTEEDHYIIRPKNQTKIKTSIINLHGGAFYFGNAKSDNNMLAKILQEFDDESIAIYNLNYPLGGESSFPEPIRSILFSISKLVNPDSKIILMGTSAGAFYVSIIAMLKHTPNMFESLKLDTKFLNSLTINGLYLLSPYLDTTNNYLSRFGNIDKFWLESLYPFSTLKMATRYNPMLILDLYTQIQIDNFYESFVIDGDNISFTNQSVEFAERVNGSLKIYADCTHGFYYNYDLEETRDFLKLIVYWLQLSINKP